MLLWERPPKPDTWPLLAFKKHVSQCYFPDSTRQGTMSTEALQTLQFSAITLACLSGLFGVYSVLVVLAIWATYRHATASSKSLRWVTIALFLDLFAHFVARSLQFARARRMRDTNEELLRWTIPLIVVGNVTTTTAVSPNVYCLFPFIFSGLSVRWDPSMALLRCL